MIVDLHCHSNNSDGALSPKDLATLMYKNGIGMWSLTDHDTVSGLLEARIESNILGLFFINGVEISSTWNGRTIHVIGLNINSQNILLLEGLKKNMLCRKDRASIIVNYLDSLGFTGSCSVIERGNNDRKYIGRPDFARFLVCNGYCYSIREAFSKYLSNDFIYAQMRTSYASLEEVVMWIKSSGGRSLIAHPLKYNLLDIELEDLLKDFSCFGGDGIEIPTSSKNKKYKNIINLIKKYDFSVSCGSDFHSFRDNSIKQYNRHIIPFFLKKVWDDFV